jgi:hypothetical protein
MDLEDAFKAAIYAALHQSNWENNCKCNQYLRFRLDKQGKVTCEVVEHNDLDNECYPITCGKIDLDPNHYEDLQGHVQRIISTEEFQNLKENEIICELKSVSFTERMDYQVDITNLLDEYCNLS